jgi:hypothetical protein
MLRALCCNARFVLRCGLFFFIRRFPRSLLHAKNIEKTGIRLRHFDVVVSIRKVKALNSFIKRHFINL